MHLTLGMCCLGYQDPKRVSASKLYVGCWVLCVCMHTYVLGEEREGRGWDGRGGEGRGGEGRGGGGGGEWYMRIVS